MQQLIELTGKRGIYIESLKGCVVIIQKVWFEENSVFLQLSSVSNLIKRYGNNSSFAEESCPFGKEWVVSRTIEMLDFTNGYLDASLYLGWRLIVNEKAVKQFENKDSAWEEDYW